MSAWVCVCVYACMCLCVCVYRGKKILACPLLFLELSSNRAVLLTSAAEDMLSSLKENRSAALLLDTHTHTHNESAMTVTHFTE